MIYAGVMLAAISVIVPPSQMSGCFHSTAMEGVIEEIPCSLTGDITVDPPEDLHNKPIVIAGRHGFGQPVLSVSPDGVVTIHMGSYLDWQRGDIKITKVVIVQD